MDGFKRVSSTSRLTLEAAVADLSVHLKRGRRCRVERGRLGRNHKLVRNGQAEAGQFAYLGFVKATPLYRGVCVNGKWRAPHGGEDTMMRYGVAAPDPEHAGYDVVDAKV